MFKLFQRNTAKSLQRKYDDLMKEAYILSKTDQEESRKKQEEARKVQTQLIAKRAA
ncbi:MAG: Lacal_2735 family protein [Ekhidna sp.]